MQLISQTAVEGRPGPNFPEAYPRIEGLSFNDPRAFVQGQPFDTFAKMRKAAPSIAYAEVPGIGHAPMLDEPAARAAIFEFLAGVA